MSVTAFSNVYCIDGSGAKSSRAERKRPIYRLVPETGAIERCQLQTTPSVFFADVLTEATPTERSLIAVDVPLGLPADFPDVYGNKGFVEWLLGLPGEDWRGLVVEGIVDQAPGRPFVEKPRAGDKRLGRFPLRRCDRLTHAESVYWCMGPKQVGKAALQFWFEVLRPLVRQGGIAVWPFQPIDDARVVVAECYPGYLVDRVWGRSVVKTNAPDVVQALAETGEARRGTDERTRLHAASSEDEFDMLTVALALRAAVEAEADVLSAPVHARPIEGWILLLEDRA